MVPNVGASPHKVLYNLGRKSINHKSNTKMRILSNNAKFSASWPLLPAYNSSTTMPTTYSTYCLGAVASLKFLAIENMLPHFSADVCYGQTAGWIRIPLGTEVCFGPGNIMLDGDSTCTRKEHSSPHFSAHCSGPHPRRPAFYP